MADLRARPIPGWALVKRVCAWFAVSPRRELHFVVIKDGARIVAELPEDYLRHLVAFHGGSVKLQLGGGAELEVYER